MEVLKHRKIFVEVNVNRPTKQDKLRQWKRATRYSYCLHVSYLLFFRLSNILLFLFLISLGMEI